MIAIDINVSYPGLTTSEEERLREHIRRSLQPHLANICCSFMRDGTLDGGDGDFLRSSKLNIDGSIRVVDGLEAADGRIV